MKVKKMRRLGKLINFWPPFFFSGIKVLNVNEMANRYEVALTLRWFNRNAYGTHFGGSLYAMCDPWYVFAAGAYFGDDYILWDRSASIQYLKPGKGRVKAIFEIPVPRLEEMKEEVDRLGKQTFCFDTHIIGPNGEQVAHVEKEIYIRKKRKKVKSLS